MLSVESVDVVVIGGGVVGASIAFHLAESGCADVLIVERGSRQCLGSTGRATGGVRAQFETEPNIRLSMYSIEFFSRFQEATGRDCAYEPNGYLFLASTDKQFSHLESNRKRQVAVGLKNVELVSPEQIAEIVPLLKVHDLVGGTFCPTDGLIDPVAVTSGFTERAKERGVRVWLDEEVSEIQVEQGRVAGVSTTRHRVSTRVIVNAAGPWAAEIGRLAGIELPIEPLRRQLVATTPIEGVESSLPMVIDAADGFHFRRLGRRNSRGETGLLLAWPDNDETPGFKEDFDPAFVPKIFDRAVRRIPAVAGAGVELGQSRAGLYEMTPDRHPILGEAPDPKGLYLANGFSGHGVMHSPATGRLIADLILNGATTLIDLEQLSLERFRQGKLIEEKTVI